MHPRIDPLGFTRSGAAVWPIAGGSDTGTGNAGQSGQGGQEPGGDPGTGSGSGPGSGASGSGAGQATGDPATGQGGQQPGAGDPATGQGGQQPGAGGQPTAGGDKGFPEGTPLEQMTADQREAYWKHYARQHEQRNKELLDLAGGSVDQLKEKVTGYDELRQAQQTEQERAVEAAKAEGRTEGLRQAAQQMVDTHVHAAVQAGRLPQATADALLDGLDRSKYLTDDYSVDTDKVTALLDSVAPAKGNGHPDVGQGRREGPSQPSGKDEGHAEAEKRFGDRVRSA